MAEVMRRSKGYTIRVSAGYDLKGKHIRKNMTWTPDPGLTEKQVEKELARQVALFEEKVASGRIIEGNIKFADFATKWISDYAEKHLAAKTVHRYRSLIVRINEAIGHVRLDRLQPVHLISFYENLSEKGIRVDLRYQAIKIPSGKDGKQTGNKLTSLVSISEQKIPDLAVKSGVSTATYYAACQGKVISQTSAKAIANGVNVKLTSIFQTVNKSTRLGDRTILHHHRLISSILSTAVEWQVIYSNPAQRVKAPRVTRSESRYLDEIQAKRLIEKLQEAPIQYRTMISLLLFLGIRRGELCGLKWSDIDFENKVIQIQRALQYLLKQGVFEKLPKNSSSMRALKMPDVTINLLKEYQKWQIDEKKACGDQWHDSDFIFTRWNGDAVNPDEITKWFRRFNVSRTLPSVNIHSLRHTNATLLIAAGTDLRTVSRRLGHAQTSTTANIYAHAIRSADEAAADTLQDILTPKRPVVKVRKSALLKKHLVGENPKRPQTAHK